MLRLPSRRSDGRDVTESVFADLPRAVDHGFDAITIEDMRARAARTATAARVAASNVI